jgi:riboflavin synthase
MKLGDRLDGHIVQGHVDQTAKCIAILEENGSWIFTFDYDKTLSNITIEKGSITVNGVSLTVVNSKAHSFSVAIIPYTYRHTTFGTLKIGDTVNLEFDVIGKYVQRLNDLRN